MPMPRVVARFNRVVTNRLLGPLAHVAPPFAIIEHEGRKSGRFYRTPVWAFKTSDGFVVALTYGGAHTEWLKNVLANGGATLVMRGAEHEVRPRVVHGSEGFEKMPVLFRPWLRALRVDDYLLLTAR